MTRRHPLGRRRFLGATLGAVAAACTDTARAPAMRRAGLTGSGAPAVREEEDDDEQDDAPPDPEQCDPTAPNIEGPFFREGAPSRASLVQSGTRGERLRLSGRVLDTACRPVAGAEIQIWHADHEGAYDNAGNRFRCALTTAQDGTWHVDTIVPGRYLNGPTYRPSHIHFKVIPPGRAVLTTQLYFEGDPHIEGDPFVHPSLIIALRETNGRREGEFDFVA